MSVYNGERFLRPAIESVLAQTFTDFEFLILDDGSVDSSVAIAREFAARDSRIRIIARENRGLVASLNQLLAESCAAIVARMDADDICAANRFERQMAFLDSNPDYDVVGSWSRDIDVDGSAIHADGVDHPVTHDEMLQAIESGGQLICHPSAMYRRDAVLAVGGYHGAFVHCEDLDLWLRLASRTKLGNIPERLLEYRRSPQQVSVRHATQQQIGTAVARLAYHERQEGRPDPTETLQSLPPVEQLDSLFGREGVSREVRERVALLLRYSKDAMQGDGYDLLLRHLRDGGSREGMWRTVARLVRFGNPLRAAHLAGVLALGA